LLFYWAQDGKSTPNSSCETVEGAAAPAAPVADKPLKSYQKIGNQWGSMVARDNGPVEDDYTDNWPRSQATNRGRHNEHRQQRKRGGNWRGEQHRRRDWDRDDGGDMFDVEDGSDARTGGETSRGREREDSSNRRSAMLPPTMYAGLFIFY